MRVYFDNAATTPLDERVYEAMEPYFKQYFGNPSSIHTHGREAKIAIERSRRQIASLLGASPAEIFFTSGATEANNTALFSIIRSKGIKHVITSRIEHHAVLHPLEYLASKGEIKLDFVRLDENGHIDYVHLTELLSAKKHILVSLMHGNNEIGNVTDIERVSSLCKEHGAIYHADTVQTIGKYTIDLEKPHPDVFVASAHKFHGPKGVGFTYVDGEVSFDPLIHGGAQERNMRGGTENIYGIVGMAKALELAVAEKEKNTGHILSLKKHTIDALKKEIPGVVFNGSGSCLNDSESLPTVLNVQLPLDDMGDMLLFNLDINQISVSAGSACSSGTDIGSHVLHELYGDSMTKPSVRISFSKYNTLEEVNYLIEKLKEICIQE
ncbi:MAG: cysteine desulfurase family protein [Cyclobacteriaceae bacterium]